MFVLLCHIIISGTESVMVIVSLAVHKHASSWFVLCAAKSADFSSVVLTLIKPLLHWV